VQFINRKIFFVFLSALALLLRCSLNTCYGQASTPGGSVRLTLLGGGNVEFIFNSMSDYKTGITYNNWTTLGISVRDEAGDINPPVGDDYTQWEIDFQAQDADGDGFITGLNAAHQLLFSVVELKATIAAGCGTCNVFASPFITLTKLPQKLVDGSSGGGWPPDQIRDVPSADNLVFGSDQINISYRCGFTTKLLGKPADYYSDDIVFTLLMQ
jgi:hypothetical protein